MKQVKLHDKVNEMLDEIVKRRKEAGALVSSKQAVIQELIINLHKKEVK